MAAAFEHFNACNFSECRLLLLLKISVNVSILYSQMGVSTFIYIQNGFGRKIHPFFCGTNPEKNEFKIGSAFICGFTLFQLMLRIMVLI